VFNWKTKETNSLQGHRAEFHTVVNLNLTRNFEIPGVRLPGLYVRVTIIFRYWTTLMYVFSSRYTGLCLKGLGLVPWLTRCDAAPWEY